MVDLPLKFAIVMVYEGNLSIDRFDGYCKQEVEYLGRRVEE